MQLNIPSDWVSEVNFLNPYLIYITQRGTIRIPIIINLFAQDTNVKKFILSVEWSKAREVNCDTDAVNTKQVVMIAETWS